ncbi:MAG: enoyl-CoA hydratase/isomerase family protein [Thermodesulfobacteriota bacterium]
MGPLAVGATKKIIKRGEGVDLMTQLDMEVNLNSILLRSKDFQEGIAALIEKRDPVWKRQ